MTNSFLGYVRITLVLLGSVAQVVMGGIPNALGWEHTIGSRSNEVQTLIVPASYAFIIWSFLFLGCIIFAIFHALPRNRTDATFIKVGWLASISFFFNAIWELYVPVYSFDIVSLIMILIILIPLISIMFLLKEQNDHRNIFTPLFALAGWVSVATFVNLSVTTSYLGFNPFNLSAETQAISFLLIAGTVTSFFGSYFKSISYTTATTWGFVAIYVINTARGESLIAYLALGLGIIGFTLAVFGKIKSTRLSLS